MTDIKLGRDKRANIGALRQAKIYPPWQAEAATMWIAAAKFEGSCHNPRAAVSMEKQSEFVCFIDNRASFILFLLRHMWHDISNL